MQKSLKVEGMHCKSCGMLLTDVLSEIAGVSKINVDFKTGMVAVDVTNDAVLAQIRAAIEKEGYKVV